MTTALPEGAVAEGVRSLEVRWIFPGQLESPVAGWFGRFPAQAEFRQDTYLLQPGLCGLSVKVRVGRALALSPPVLLLEHASAGLSAGDAAAAGQWIRAVAERRGAAALAATADEGFARAVADRVLLLEPASGRLRERGLRGWFRG